MPTVGVSTPRCSVTHYALAISASLVPGTSALSVLTDRRRSPARVHKSPGRAGARSSRGGPFGRHAPRTAQVPRTPSHLPFRSEIPQFTFANEISLRNKVSTSYLCHNSQISEDKIALLVLLKNGSHISTPQRNVRFHVGTFRHEIAHVQEDVARMRERRRDVTIFSAKNAKTAKIFDLCGLCGAQHLIAEGIFTMSNCTR